jgi:hypothetical protein
MTNHTLLENKTNKDLKMFSTFYDYRMRPERKAELSKVYPDADAFQKLCCDLLAKEFKEEFPTMHLSKFPLLKADGAIDFCGETFGANNEDHFKLIGECKKNDSLANAITQRDNLIEKLIVHIRNPNAENTLYAPWFDPKLKQYVYCTSCNINTKKDRDDFTNPIQDVLFELSKEPHLEHLKIVADNIVLYTWDDLLSLLKINRFVYHWWVEGDYVAGVEPLTLTIKPDQPQYKDYLSSAKQPYFSRDDYVKQNPEANELITETGILNTLLDNPRYEGCIVYGEGGIGKTRLMLELGSMAAKQEWIVFRVIDKRPNLDRLKTMFYPGYRYLLLFDYIEESPDFDDPGFFRRITRLVDGAEVKIIGNCRKTHFDNSELKDAEGFFCHDLSIKDLKLQQDYKDRVVKHILGDLVHLFKVDESFYRLKPAFAVLLKYHDQKDHITEMELDFRGEGAFREWLKKQLIRTFDLTNYKELSKQEKFFHIFFILSSSTGISLGPLMADFKQTIQALLKDGWVDIEEVNGQKEIRISHDTIAEEVLILRLRDCKELLEEEIKSIFDFAMSYNGLETCLRLFERISGWVHDPDAGDPGHLKKNSQLFYRLFSDEIARYPGYWSYVKNALVKTPLMDEPEEIKLILEHPSFFKEIIQSKTFGLDLAFKIRYLHKNKAQYTVEIFEQVKKQLHSLVNQWSTINPDFFNSPYISSRVLASVTDSVGMSGEWEPGVRMEIKLKEWLDEYHLEKQTKFVLCSWLKARGEKQVVTQFVSRWLEKYPLEMETHSVIKSWLDARGEKEVIEKFVPGWLEKYPLEMETRFVLCSWLDARGEKEHISKFVSQWLEKYPLEMETSFVIKSWLKSGGEKAVVSKFVYPWLERYSLEKEMSFVLCSWLNAGGDPELVSSFVFRWLEKYLLEKETSFVIKSWFKAGGETELFAKSVIRWLEEYPLEKETQYVLHCWLKAGGDLEVVSPFVIRWLEEYPLEKENQFLLHYWLKGGGDKKIASKFVFQWLERFALEGDARHVLCGWLDAGGNTDLVRQFIRPWLELFSNDKENAAKVIKSWLDSGGDPQEVNPFI